MNNYKDIKRIYDNSVIYNNEFINYDDDFSFWIYWIKKLLPQKVLEIGIGNGRLIKLLSNLVENYDGLDFSKKIISDFKDNNSWFKGNLFHQDMKKIRIKQIYDLIIVPFNTFCYLYTYDDFANFFDGLKKISDNDTIIIIDIINPKLSDLVDTKKFKLCNQFFVNDKNYKVYEKHCYNSDIQVINYLKKYILSDNKEIVFNLPVRIFFPQELLNLIKFFGYTVVNIYGDYNNEIYNCNSRKQILFIKRSDK